MIAATERKSNTTQNDVTEKLGERVQNINYWKFELERGIQGTFMDRYVALILHAIKMQYLFKSTYDFSTFNIRYHCRK